MGQCIRKPTGKPISGLGFEVHWVALGCEEEDEEAELVESTAAQATDTTAPTEATEVTGDPPQQKNSNQGVGLIGMHRVYF